MDLFSLLENLKLDLEWAKANEWGKLQFVLLTICKKLLKSLKRRWKNNGNVCVL